MHASVRGNRRIGKSQASCPTFCQPVHLAALKDLLTDEEIEVVCSQLGHQWRNRIFTPAVTVRSLVYRSLNPDKTIENVLADMVANEDALETEPTDSAWCQARSRLPEAVWPELTQRSANRLDRAVGNKHLYQGRPIYIVAFSGPLRIATGPERKRIYNRMLGTIARHTNLDRPGRVEPRRVKRDPVRYPFLTIPREEARRKCLS